MRSAPVHLCIDELVLVGFTGVDRQGIHDALQGALAELLAGGESGWPGRSESLALDSAPPRTIRLAGPRPLQQLAAGVAQAVVGSVGAGLQSGR
jgi:hypothetical protein